LVLYRVGVPLKVALGRCPVAVAGTRDPTPWGRRLAWEIGHKLAEAGYTVVTGLARGVDEEAAAGALETGGCAVAVLPYLFERDGKLNPRVLRLLRVAASSGALVSAVAENLVKDDGRVRVWLAARNRIITHMAAVLVVPEAKFKLAHWGTRYAVEYALAAERFVIVLEPRAKSSDVVKAFEYFKRRGAVAARDVDEVLNTIKRRCSAKDAQ